MSTLSIVVSSDAGVLVGEIRIPIENILQFVLLGSQRELKTTIEAMTVNAAELRAPDIEGYIERLQKLQRDARLAQSVLIKGKEYTARIERS